MKALLYLFSGAALAQTLVPVTAPVSDGLPWMWIILAGIVLAAVGYVVWRHGHATGAAKVEAVASQAGSAVSADVTKLIASIHALIFSLQGNVALTPITATLTTTEPPAPAGKSGQPGTFTIPVTGDPKVDIPAITTQYLQS